MNEIQQQSGEKGEQMPAQTTIIVITIMMDDDDRVKRATISNDTTRDARHSKIIII